MEILVHTINTCCFVWLRRFVFFSRILQDEDKTLQELGALEGS